jgi:hypothetical protein
MNIFIALIALMIGAPLGLSIAACMTMNKMTAMEEVIYTTLIAK